MRQQPPQSTCTNEQTPERSPSLAFIKAAVLRDLVALTNHLHDDGRGLSDGILFLMNAYQAARCVPHSATVRRGIIRRAGAVAEEYNRCAASGTLESMDVLLFELYYTTRSSRCECAEAYARSCQRGDGQYRRLLNADVPLLSTLLPVCPLLGR